MTTVGLEHTNFIDPSLTWKTVSKGRNTSRRSRRSASKNLIMVQEQGRKSPEHVNGAQVSESEKNIVTFNGRRFGGNMEHIPIKKRRFMLRSPSPSPQFPIGPQEQEGPATNHCCSDKSSCSDLILESQGAGVGSFSGIKASKSVSDGEVDNNKTLILSNGVQSSGEDFSGIAILAAAACSGRLDNSSEDVGRSQMADILKGKLNESFAPAVSEKENNACLETPDLLKKDNAPAKEEGSLAALLNDGIGVDPLKNSAGNVGMNLVSEPSERDQNESVASGITRFLSIDCVGSPDMLAKDDEQAVHTFLDLRNDSGKVSEVLGAEVTGKSVEESAGLQDRLHWDLNTVMDEWYQPFDDAVGESGKHLVEVRPTNTEDGQTFEKLEGSETLERSETPVSVVTNAAQPAVWPESGSMVLPESARVDSDSPVFGSMGHDLKVSSGLVTNILKEKCSPCNESSHVKGTSFELVETDMDVDHSLSLGLNEPKVLVCEGFHNRAASGDLSVINEKPLSTLPREKRAIDFLLEPVHGGASGEKKIDSCKFVADFKERNVLDENVNRVEAVACESMVSNSFDSSEDGIASRDVFEWKGLSCRVNDVKNSEPSECIGFVGCDENSHGKVTIQPESHPSGSEDPMLGLEDPDVAHCTSKLKDTVATSATFHDKQDVDPRVANDSGDKPVVSGASQCDPLRDCGSVARVPKMSDHSAALSTVIAKRTADEAMVTDTSQCDPTVDTETEAHVPKMSERHGAIDEYSKPINSPVNHQENVLCGGHDSNNEDSSQVTENTGNGTEFEGGYESHLEDGELRESVGHCWEENEGEDGDTEHVDYESDNGEGAICFDDANGSVQLSGEVLADEYEKQACRSDNFSSADDQPNPNKSVEQKCSHQLQCCLSTVGAVETECTKREFSTSKACSTVQRRVVNNPDRGEMDHKGCRSSGVEAVSTGKDINSDALRNVRGTCPNGSELQSSDRRVTDSIRRSRSRNFGCVHDNDDSDESFARDQSSLRMDRFAERPSSIDLKSVIANSKAEDNGEREVRASDDSPPRVRRHRIISTSRSGCHSIRRGSPGGRNNDYSMEMLKVRGVSAESNARGRFGRFSNGISRGFREGGLRAPGMYDGAKSSGSMLNHFGKRERSLSPVGNRADPRFPRSHRKSRSRSRTRSPEFSPEVRIGRTRLPYQPAGHAAEQHMRERRSPLRLFSQGQRFDSNISPGRLRSDDCMRPTMRPVRFHDAVTTSGRGHDYEESNDYRRRPFFQRSHRRSRSRSRSCSPDFRPAARMGTMRIPYQPSGDHIRDRRSPMKVFRSTQRYDGRGSPGRLRSDDCLRPMMRPVRFPDTAQSGRAGHEYNNDNGDEYRRKPRNIFERIHPVRHYDIDAGDVRRFEYDEEDVVAPQNFRRNENYGRAGERRPVEGLRSNREERINNVRYDSDRMFYSGPKQFGGMRDYTGEDAPLPRRVRP